ncbi:MAG: hypothetical protein AABZ08_09040 [Planctomycetota bacterium]
MTLNRKKKPAKQTRGTSLFGPPPTWRKKAKGIIIKHGYCIDGTKRKSIPVFELLLLADASGFEFLSRYFQERARAAKNEARFLGSAQGPDPDDHDHLVIWQRAGDFNTRLSDSMEIRIGTLTKSNRSAVLKKYAISAASRRHGSMAPQLRALAKEAERQVKKEETSRRKHSTVHRRRKETESPGRK